MKYAVCCDNGFFDNPLLSVNHINAILKLTTAIVYRVFIDIMDNKFKFKEIGKNF